MGFHVAVATNTTGMQSIRPRDADEEGAVQAVTQEKPMFLQIEEAERLNVTEYTAGHRRPKFPARPRP